MLLMYQTVLMFFVADARKRMAVLELFRHLRCDLVRADLLRGERVRAITVLPCFATS